MAGWTLRRGALTGRACRSVFQRKCLGGPCCATFQHADGDGFYHGMGGEVDHAFQAPVLAQLPAYVLRPESYDDVETVVRRVRTKQPVALIFVGVRTEVAKRVLDFSYGFACGLGATVKEVGDRVFMVLPAGCEVKDSDLKKLRADGYLK